MIKPGVTVAQVQKSKAFWTWDQRSCHPHRLWWQAGNVAGYDTISYPLKVLMKSAHVINGQCGRVESSIARSHEFHEDKLS